MPDLPIPPDVARQAMEWLLSLQETPEDGELRRRWLHWRGAHPDHDRAWRRIETVNTRLHGLDRQAARAALAPSANRRRTIKLAAALLTAGGAGWLGWSQTPLRRLAADMYAGVGAPHTEQLADGTRLALNSGTAVDIRYDDDHRRIVLLEGEILVRSAPDPRPLLVSTRDGEVRTHLARFSLRQYDGFCRVSVFEDAVELHPAGESRAMRLEAGRFADMSRTGIHDEGPADPDATAWQQGMLIATDMRLDEFLSELSRHRPGLLSCDPAVAGLRISGSYPLADPDRVLHALTQALPLQLRTASRYWVRVMPRGA